MLCHILLYQINGVLKNQDFITHNHSHQRNKSEDRSQSQCTIHQSETYQGTRNHQCKCRHTNSGNAILLEIEQQEEEYNHHRNGNTPYNLRYRLIAIFYLTSNFCAHTLRQFNLIFHYVGNAIFYRRGKHALCEMACNGDTTLTTTMHDTTLCPLWLHLCYLAQRHGRILIVQSCREHRNGRCHTQIFNIGESHILIVAHHDRYFVIVLPQLTYTQIARRGSQGQSSRRARKAQLSRGYRVELHINQRIGCKIVGMYPLQFWHLSHSGHQAIGYCM